MDSETILKVKEKVREGTPEKIVPAVIYASPIRDNVDCYNYDVINARPKYKPIRSSGEWEYWSNKL